MISKEEVKKKYQFVVARYNEDIQWLFPFKDIVYLYNKGNYHPSLDSFKTIALPNIGRESHTYLTHIVENYDNLAEHVLFFQAHIDDHKRLPFNEYFGFDGLPPVLDPILILNGENDMSLPKHVTTINNVCFPSQVSLHILS
jgi:hypothetical protein